MGSLLPRKPWNSRNTVVDTARWISWLNLTALVTIMLSMGLQVNIQAVLASARPARLVMLGLLANFVLVPAVTLGLLYVFQADPMVSAGFLRPCRLPGSSGGTTDHGHRRGEVYLRPSE